MTTPRVLVVGAGALGGVIAAKLTRARVDVTVLDSNVEHVSRMRSPGLVIDELGSEWSIPLDAVSRSDELVGPFDFALVVLKAPFIEAALAPLVENDLVATFVSLGNGLVQERIAAVAGNDSMVIGTVSWGASNLGPGHVAQTTIAPIAIGEVSGQRTPRLLALAEILEPVAEIHVTDRVYGQVWSKLLLNSTFSGLGAVSGLVYADVVAQPGGGELAFSLWTEGYDVAMAQGIVLDNVAGIDPSHLVVRGEMDLPRARRALRQLMARIGATKASMLQDLERGAVTEVTVINGGVVGQANAIGIEAPLNARIVELVHECERGEREPDVTNLDDLVQLIPVNKR